jgi:hypothetical protein
VVKCAKGNHFPVAKGLPIAMRSRWAMRSLWAMRSRGFRGRDFRSVRKFGHSYRTTSDSASPAENGTLPASSRSRAHAPTAWCVYLMATGTVTIAEDDRFQIPRKVCVVKETDVLLPHPANSEFVPKWCAVQDLLKSVAASQKIESGSFLSTRRRTSNELSGAARCVVGKPSGVFFFKEATVAVRKACEVTGRVTARRNNDRVLVMQESTNRPPF